MNKKELSTVAEKLFNKCLDMMNIKNADYTAGKENADALFNFHYISNIAETTKLKVWLVYYTKHYLSIVKYINSGRLESEGIEGRIIDSINYLILLQALINEDNVNKKEVEIKKEDSGILKDKDIDVLFEGEEIILKSISKGIYYKAIYLGKIVEAGYTYLKVNTIDQKNVIVHISAYICKYTKEKLEKLKEDINNIELEKSYKKIDKLYT